MDILVTGFGPFPHVRVNPTTVLARAVAKRLSASGLKAEALVLETSYSGGLPALRAHIEQLRPRAVLMLGLAARARWLRVEIFARGRASLLHPDVSGHAPGRAAQGATVLPAMTTGSRQAALATFRRQGIRAQLSASAGRYLCDASYAAALAATRHSGVPVIFIHVPWLRPEPGVRRSEAVAAFRPGRVQLTHALARLGSTLARAGRLNCAGTGQASRHEA